MHLERKAHSDNMVATIMRKVRWMRILQVFFDAVLTSVALTIAYLIRFDAHIPQVYSLQLGILAPVLISLTLLCNWSLGVYRRLWRYTGLVEISELARAVLAANLMVLVLRASRWLHIHGHDVSYGIIFIEAVLSFLFLVTPRVLRRLQVEHRRRRHRRQPLLRRALLIGAGDAGQMVVKELLQRPDLGVDVVGVLDDDLRKMKNRIGNATVIGTTQQLPELVENLFIDQVILAMPSAPPAEVRRIVDMCRTAEVETRILPGLFELIDGKVSINQLREVSLEDLLGREPVELDSAAIAGYIEGRRVIVTGAGGSIGSELCRQIIKFQPQELLLLGRGENSIFQIQQELSTRPEPVSVIPIIADVRDHNRMLNIFEKHKPQVVFHAAAHKHVPLMEQNVSEAITNNIGGTRNIAELATEFGVETFVLVSSDKAVNPTSVMGATKRIAELVIQDLAVRSKTKYVAVRFGNVLASRGSVIPTWRTQIAAGGPVTVTHPEATRYFMLIPEAVQLIMQAGALGLGGEIFVLDMGKPVKIAALAHDLIKLSGLRPNEDIAIEFVGLRPGEKLYEELLTAEEGLTQTNYKKILVGQPQPIESERLMSQLKNLSTAATREDEAAIRQALTHLVGSNLVAEEIVPKI